MSENIKSSIGNIYGNFIMRDFTFISSGFLILSSVVYSLDITIDIGKIPNNNVLMIFISIVVLFLSYFLGFIAQESLHILHVVKTSSVVPQIYEKKFNSVNNILLMSDIDKYFGIPTVKRLERLIFVKQIGSAFGSSFIIISIFLLIHLINSCSRIDWLLFLSAIVLSKFCIIVNRVKWKKHNSALDDLANRIKLCEYLENLFNLIDNKSKKNILDSEEFKNFRNYYYNKK